MAAPIRRQPGEGFELAYTLASQQLASLDDVEEQCRRAGAECQVTGGRGRITVAYLGRPYI
ncbi:MAG: hypothetical protein V1780_02135, partial [Chloroflexota bacterium]